MIARSSAPAKRRAAAVESFKTAAECIGPVEPGMSLFAITRGQFSMLDAVLHVLQQLGPSRLSLWTWCIASYEIQAFTELMLDDRITDGLLVIDGSVRRQGFQAARKEGADPVSEWRRTFGRDSVRYCSNHAKIATVEGGGRKVLLRGSMNLNFNPRFEQLDVTEGGPDFDLVRQIEGEIPRVSDNASDDEVHRASRAGEAFDQATLAMFTGAKVWAKLPRLANPLEALREQHPSRSVPHREVRVFDGRPRSRVDHNGSMCVDVRLSRLVLGGRVHVDRQIHRTDVWVRLRERR